MRGDHLVKRNQFDTCDGLLRAISFALLSSAMPINLGVHDDQNSTTIASEIKSSGIKAFQGGLHLRKRRVVGGALIGNHRHTALVYHPSTSRYHLNCAAREFALTRVPRRIRVDPSLQTDDEGSTSIELSHDRARFSRSAGVVRGWPARSRLLDVSPR